jgi:hypothetical protein
MARAVSGSGPLPLRLAARSLKKALPLVLASTLGPAAGRARRVVLQQRFKGVNVKDVQSKFKVEVYDEAGKLMKTLPYDQLPKQ